MNLRNRAILKKKGGRLVLTLSQIWTSQSHNFHSQNWWNQTCQWISFFVIFEQMCSLIFGHPAGGVTTWHIVNFHQNRQVRRKKNNWPLLSNFEIEKWTYVTKIIFFHHYMTREDAGMSYLRNSCCNSKFDKTKLDYFHRRVGRIQDKRAKVTDGIELATDHNYLTEALWPCQA